MPISIGFSTKSWKRSGIPRRGGALSSARNALAAGFALSLICFFPACSTEPRGEGIPVSLEAGPVQVTALDQNRVRFSLDLSVENHAGRARELDALSCTLALDGTQAAVLDIADPIVLPPGERRVVPMEFTIDLREFSEGPAKTPERSELLWSLEAEARLRVDGGPGESVGAKVRGVCPLVREPQLELRSIVLVQYELINVILEMVLDVRNPNAFPVDLSAVSYEFYGEGRRWTAGTADRTVTIPARGQAEVRLPILLNFTEMGRNVFDLVARLGVVRYRLSGEARVRTGMPFLPEFRMRFDRTGAAPVEGSLAPSAR